MTDREALLLAVDLLRTLRSVAGGFVSPAIRAKIERLEQYVTPELPERYR